MLIAMARDLDLDLEDVEEVGDLEDLRQGLDEERLVDTLEQHLERSDDPAPGQKGA